MRFIIQGENMLQSYGNYPVPNEWIVDEKIPPGYSRMYFIHSGEVSYQDQDNPTPKKLLVNEAYLFPSASTFKITHNPENPLVCTYLHIDVLPIIITSLVELNISNNQTLYHLMHSIKSAVASGNGKVVSALSTALIEILVAKKMLAVPLMSISRVLEYISDNINKPFTIEELSRISGYQQNYFIRLFKKSIGISPYAYISNLKLKQAVKLIETGLSVSEVANQLGYSDLKTFSRAFTDKFGVAPTKFHKTEIPGYVN